MPTSKPSAEVLETVTVDLGDRSYPIHIGSGLLASRPELLRSAIKGGSVLVVTNETLAPLHLDKVVRALKEGGGGSEADGAPPLAVYSVVLPDGEDRKTVGVLEQVWTAALEHRLDRRTTFVALGGGVVGDMTGFAAACYQRGVAFVQVPTTVMAQVDSSVGGKTGVNHPLGKNMVGAFWQPEAVVVDLDLLSTLPDREFRSGLAEAAKYGMIADAPFFEWLEREREAVLARDPAALAALVRRSCEDKALVVAADEKEGGVRATLNLGHTFGHAIEAGLGYGAWLHGEAVAAGTAMAARMSRRLGWIDADLERRVVGLLTDLGLPTAPPPGRLTASQFLGFMSVDKKVLDGALRLVLLKGELGNCVVTADYPREVLDAVLAEFCNQ